MSDPIVSVVLPCFNAEHFLSEAIDSLLAQTYDQIEIVALDDGSRDGTAEILERYTHCDRRVRVLTNSTNRGLIATLNRGVAAARGDFIARMDADDISVSDRIERQLEVLARRPDVDVIGSAVRLTDGAGRETIRPRPVRCIEPGAAWFMALFATPLAHVTLLGRAPVMKAHRYGGSSEAVHTEDYELFTRMLEAGISFLNLDEPLVQVRVREAGVSRSSEAAQVANFLACSHRHLERTLGFRPRPRAHAVLVNRMDRSVSRRDLRSGLDLLDRVEREGLRREPRARDEIRGIADEQRVDILVQAARRGRPQVRFAAGLLALRYARRLVTSARARRYLMKKLHARQIPLWQG